METEEYLKDKLKTFLAECSPITYLNNFSCLDKQCKNQWKNENEHWRNVKYGEIVNNDDILILCNTFANRVKFYENVKRSHINDSFDMYKDLYFCTEGLRKASQNLDNSYCNFHYTNDDIDKIFTDLKCSMNRMEDINMKRACQD